MAGIKFHKEHAWVRVEGEIGTVGISDYAQSQLRKIIYVELPEDGKEIVAGEPFGQIESNKTTSDLIAPVSGEVVESNGALDDKPKLVNESPHDQGWITKVKLSNPSELDKLMDEAAYNSMLGK
jgi:glycine cleavage system H protein